MKRNRIAAAIATALFLGACGMPGEGVKPPELGKLESYQYSYSGGMSNRYYEARVSRDSEGKAWLFETSAVDAHPSALRVAYRFALPGDSLERLETYLKENRLWVEKPFASSGEFIPDGYTYAWGFETERGFFDICTAMVPEDGVRKRLSELNGFVESLRGDAKREKDPNYPLLRAEDIVGIQVRDESRNAWLLVTPEQIELVLDAVRRPLVEISYEELLGQIRVRYTDALAEWGDQIWDLYPLENTDQADSGGFCRIDLFVRSEEEGVPYQVVNKLDGPAAENVASFVESIFDLLSIYAESQ